jgi:hypothetical protein
LKSFAQSPEGRLYLADGFTAVKRWEGFGTALVKAGVPAPSNTPTVTGSGSGRILGPFYAYFRYLDVDGQPSNLSPVSAEYTGSSPSSGTISGATNASPILVTSTAHGLSDGDTVMVEDGLGNLGMNGTWYVDAVDANTFRLYEAYDSGTTTFSRPSVGTGVYKGGASWTKGRGTVTYGNLGTAFPDSRAVTIQIFRTKPGDATVAYLDYESGTHPTNTQASTKTDDDLGEAVVITDLADRDLAVNYYTQPPAYKRFLTHCNGRMVAAGDPIYTAGIVKVTNGSPTVTGYNTAWTSDLVDRYLWVEGADKAYLIDAVGGAGTLTLAENYDGTSSNFARYGIRAETGERRTLHWSQAGLSEAWNPLDNAVTLPEDAQAGEITGLFTHQRWVLVTAEDRIWRFSYLQEPENDGFTAFGPGRGCVNNRCVVIADDMVYMLDRRGVFAVNGNDVRPISDAIQNVFDPQSDSPVRVQWAYKDQFHMVFDQENDTVLCFVSLSGGPPRHALAYRRAREKWDVLEFPVPMLSSCVGRLSGRRQVFCGTSARRVVAVGNGQLDGGPFNGTTRGTVTNAGIFYIDDSAATFDLSAIGSCVRIVEGRGAGQWRLVTAVAATRFTVNQPWSVMPDTTSVYQLGGVEWLWRTGWFAWDRSDAHEPRALEVQFDPRSADSTLRAEVFRDRSLSPEVFRVTVAADDNDGVGIEDGDSVLAIDPTKSNGFVRQRLDGNADSNADGERLVQVQLGGVTNGLEPHKIYEVVVEGAIA